MLHGTTEDFMASDAGLDMRGKVQLVFTSPPFPLKRKKKYGNLQGEEYVDWIGSLAPQFRDLVTDTGSIVIEIGNAWDEGQPTMSTLPLRALLKFQEVGELHLCQQFVSFNPARLPGPAEWVNRQRVRVKDAFTYVWWLSPTPHPDADNRRVLTEYSASMNRLLATGKYNAGRRPSEHDIGSESFNKNNGGAIPPNVLTVSNTRAGDAYQRFCTDGGVDPHPARMPEELARFFINFLTHPNQIVYDPFAGSNTTGAVAEDLGRRWIATEANEDYIRGSFGRFPDGSWKDSQ
jgi:site-specific DNA-methyltransferase (cytosine-N4-specific)